MTENLLPGLIEYVRCSRVINIGGPPPSEFPRYFQDRKLSISSKINNLIGSTAEVALEGALKLKEISYIHAEGLPRRRDETRTQRPHRRVPPRRHHCHQRPAGPLIRTQVRKDPLQHSGSDRALRYSREGVIILQQQNLSQGTQSTL